eukprot:6845657-Pyramimonas_sp.AAC.1
MLCGKGLVPPQPSQTALAESTLVRFELAKKHCSDRLAVQLDSNFGPDAAVPSPLNRHPSAPTPGRGSERSQAVRHIHQQLPKTCLAAVTNAHARKSARVMMDDS